MKTEIETKKILEVRSDILFHDLFNDKDITTLEWVVSKILDCDYEDIKGKVKVLNIRLTRVNKTEKNKYVDLIVEYKNENIIIELNNNFKGIYTRNILYAANVLLNNYKVDLNNVSDYYSKVVRVLLVNLNWYSGNKGVNIDSKKIYEIPYSDVEESGYLLKIINVNLDYYKNVCYDKVNNLDKFYKLLTINNQEDLDSILREENNLKYYGNKLKDLSSNKEYTEAIMDEIIEENVAKQTLYILGNQDGIEQNQQEIVMNMYKEEFSLDVISKVTKLPIDKIQAIITNSVNNN